MQTQVVDVGFGYSPYPHELSRNPGISLQAKGLYAVYGSFVSVTDPSAWPSSYYIRKLCGIGKDAFRKYKRELVMAGWISEEQRHRENGQYSTTLVTRYYSPALNPFFVVKSTVVGKTVPGKTVTGKSGVQEQEPQEPNKKYTQTKASCVSLGELKQEQKDCIEWTIAEALRNGTLRNPAGLRVVLTRAAHDGTLYMADFEASQASKRQKEQGGREIIDQVGEWAKEAKEDPITSSFFEEQKKLYPALFT
jgi:hypothetical protein